MADQARMPSFIAKYNRYVDNIMEKINKVLRTGYDPVNVRLHSVNKKEKKPAKSNNKSGDKKKKNNKKKSKKSNKNKSKSRGRKDLKMDSTNEVNVTISNVTVTKENEKPTTTETVVLTTTTPKIVSRAQPPKKNNKDKNSSTSSNKNKASSTKNSKPRAKATLYGMASLKRSDDVVVNVMNTHTTVKSKFSIGPLTLKVEKEFGRGAKKELRSATATTTEMVGKINLRIEHGGTAKLHSIRVMQPNLLRVDTPDDHDETREFVWKRSSHIAEIVSQKLSKAAKSLLNPEPTQPPKQKNKKKPANDGIFSYFL